MKPRSFGPALTAVGLLLAAPAYADNITIATKSVGSVVEHPLEVVEGVSAGVPTAVNMTNTGALDVTCVDGCSGSGGALTKANAADPTLTEGSTSNPISVDLTGYARTLVKGAVTANIGTVGTLATSANVTGVQGATNGGTAATASTLVGGTYRTSLPTLTNGQQSALALDVNSRALVVCASGCSGGTQFAEDAAHTTGDLGTLSLVVRSDTAANTAGTTGDYSALINDSIGRLWTHNQAAASDYADGWDVTQGTKADSAWTSGSGSVISLLKAIAGAAIDTTTPSPVKIDQTTDGTTNAVHLTAGTNLVGKVGIDQTTPGTTNGVRSDASGATGSAVPSRAEYSGANSGGSLVGIIQADSSVAINVSTATTTQLVALSSGKKIYVTSLDVIAAGSGNITFEYGTGSNCGTGTTALTGAYNLTAQAGIAKGSGLGPVLVVPASNALCVVTSAAVQMSGSVAYTQF